VVSAGALVLSSVIAVNVAPASAGGFGYDKLNHIQRRLVSGTLSAELDTASASASARTHTVRPLRAAVPQMPGVNGCRRSRGADVKVNVNCLNLADADLQGRSQAQNETSTAVDPTNPAHVVASYNDYRRGDGTCGVSYSLNTGRTWADSTVPDSFTRGDFVGAPRQYWQAGGDTSVAWDTKGNTYLSCQVFNRGNAASPNPDQSSAFYVYRSTGTKGASWNFPGRPVATHNDTAGAGNVLLDKQLLTVDNHPSSRYADRVYVTWTTFAADGTAYIYEAYSTDYAETFSAPVLVSSDSALCGNAYGYPTPSGRCNENQFSQPFVGADGTLYVTFANFNNIVKGSDNRNQVFLARSTNGGRSFAPVTKVTDYYDLHCGTYQGGQDAGRACVPEKGPSRNSIFRATNYPVGAADPTDPNRVVVTMGSYINRNSNERNGCTPAGTSTTFGTDLYTGVKTGGCNNDILYSVSTNKGGSFSGSHVDPQLLPVASDNSAQARTDQFWQWASFTRTGTLAVSYYDRSYGRDNTTGYSDITVSTSTDRTSFTHQRATTSSMPPPTEFSGIFYGDYMGMDATGRTAHPVWSDTRTPDGFLCPGTGTPTQAPAVCVAPAPNAPLANDQDIYTRAVTIP